MTDTPATSPLVQLVLNDLRVGGAERQSYLLARELNRRGIPTGIIGFASPGPLQDLCRAAGIPCRYEPIPYPFSTWYAPIWCLKVLALLWRLRPRVVVAYTSVPQAYCGSVWRLSPVRACVWNQRTAGLDRMLRPLEWLASRSCPAFVANAEIGADFVRGKLGVPAGRVRVIPNGIEVPEPVDRDAVRRELGLEPGDFAACMVANVRRYKNHGTLLDGWERVVPALRERGLRAVLLLAGRVNPEGEVHVRRAEEGPLRGHVRFLGYRDDVARVLQAADLGVFSSLTEASPNGVLECMAARLPVVATDLPGIRECLPPEQHPELCPPEDAAALAARIIALAADPARRAALAAANQARIDERYGVARMADAYEELLRPWLKRRSPA